MKQILALTGFVLVLGFQVQQAAPRAAQSHPQAEPQARQEKKTAPKINPETLKKYVGRYQLEVGIIPISTLDVTLNNEALWVKPSLVRKRRLIHKSRSLFLDEVEGARYQFSVDSAGVVSSLTFEFEGSEYTAQRVELPAPSLKGNTTFRLRGFDDANVVALAGSFNNWDQSSLVFGREEGAWICRIDLEPGSHTYKFIVDGNWVLDPENPDTEVDAAGNTNNVLVKK